MATATDSVNAPTPYPPAGGNANSGTGSTPTVASGNTNPPPQRSQSQQQAPPSKQPSTDSSAPAPQKDEGREQPQEEEKGAAKGEGEGAGDAPPAQNGMEYPEQLHAGKVDGVGPEFAKQQQTTFSDRLQGVKEQIKGTLKRDPELKQTGKDRMTGELKKRQREDQDKSDPFSNAKDENKDDAKKDDDKMDEDKKEGDSKEGDKMDEDKPAPPPDVKDKEPSSQVQAGMSEGPTSHPTAKGAEEEAASVRPEGEDQSRPEKRAKSNAENAQVTSN